jgi:hypothetical protein
MKAGWNLGNVDKVMPSFGERNLDLGLPDHFESDTLSFEIGRSFRQRKNFGRSFCQRVPKTVDFGQKWRRSVLRVGQS